MKKGLSTEITYDAAGNWLLIVRKERGKLTLEDMEFAKDRNERNRIATSLQQSRRTRRINKDMAKMNEKLVKFFEDQKNRDILNRLRQLLGQQRKEEEYLLGERTYKPRAGMR